jgi:hypothetical protein
VVRDARLEVALISAVNMMEVVLPANIIRNVLQKIRLILTVNPMVNVREQPLLLILVPMLNQYNQNAKNAESIRNVHAWICLLRTVRRQAELVLQLTQIQLAQVDRDAQLEVEQMFVTNIVEYVPPVSIMRSVI